MIAIERLAIHALGDASESEASAIDEHVLACTACAATLERLLRIGVATQELVRGGRFMFPVTASLDARLRAEGLVSRSYRLGPDAIVPCAVSATDTYAMTTLEADLEGVTRATLVVTRPEAPGAARLEMADVPFDVASGTVSFITRSSILRELPSGRVTLELYANEPREYLLGRYFLDHTAFGS